MASTEVLEQPSQSQKSNKTWVLRVSIHCEGCKRKVKKILQSLPGVHDVDVETRLQRAVVTGDVSPETLIGKLVKAGKHAELWPEKAERQPRNFNPPENNNNNQKSEKAHTNQESISEESANSGKEIKPPATKTEIPAQDLSKNRYKAGVSGGGKVDEVAGNGVKVAVEVKVEEKKPETGSAGNQKEEQTEKNAGVIAGGAGGGEAKKKKKKKGQNSNKRDTGETSSPAPPPVIRGIPPATTVMSNQSPPRHHGYQCPPPQYYTPPPAPVYAVSFNTAHPPVNSYTASYYAVPPPYSHAYSHSGSEMEPAPPAPYRPLDFDSYTQQPLDSFEMFSDENPNGCLVM